MDNQESEEYLDISRELRKLWNMKVSDILIVIGAPWSVPNILERELEELEIGRQVDTIQITSLLLYILKYPYLISMTYVQFYGFIYSKLKWFAHSYVVSSIPI